MLNQVPRHKTYGGVEVQRHSFTTLVLYGSDKLHAPVALYVKSPVPTGWVGPRVGPNAVAKREKSVPHPCRESNPIIQSIKHTAVKSVKIDAYFKHVFVFKMRCHSVTFACRLFH